VTLSMSPSGAVAAIDLPVPGAGGAGRNGEPVPEGVRA
jgi:hypothetical protein